MSTLKHYFTAKGLDITNINSCPPPPSQHFKAPKPFKGVRRLKGTECLKPNVRAEQIGEERLLKEVDEGV